VCLVTSAACPVANTAANTIALLFTVKSLSGGPGAAVSAPHIAANWLATWRALDAGGNTELYYAQATTDASGMITCSAGRPLSVYNDAEPKAVEYTLAGNSGATAVASGGCIANNPANTIEIDVPFSAVGASATTELYALTGWSGSSLTALPASACSAD